jgi:hypothetical protein
MSFVTQRSFDPEASYLNSERSYDPEMLAYRSTAASRDFAAAAAEPAALRAQRESPTAPVVSVDIGKTLPVQALPVQERSTASAAASQLSFDPDSAALRYRPSVATSASFDPERNSFASQASFDPEAAMRDRPSVAASASFDPEKNMFASQASFDPEASFQQVSIDHDAPSHVVGHASLGSQASFDPEASPPPPRLIPAAKDPPPSSPVLTGHALSLLPN